MAMTAGFHRTRLRHARLLAQTGQRVIFTEEGDHRAAFAPFAHHGGGNAGDFLGDAETLMAQLGQMLGGGTRLSVAHLRHRPDLVAEVDETRLDCIDAPPNIATVVHFRSLIPCADARVNSLSPSSDRA